MARLYAQPGGNVDNSDQIASQQGLTTNTQVASSTSAMSTNPTPFGRFSRLSVELRRHIYGFCKADCDRMAVRDPWISNTTTRQHQSKPIIVRLTPLAATSKCLYEEIHEEAKGLINTITLHEMSIHYDFARTYVQPQNMSSWIGAKHITVKVLIGTPHSWQFASIEKKWPGTKYSLFCTKLLVSLPHLETLVCKVKDPESEKTDMMFLPEHNTAAHALIAQDLDSLLYLRPHIQHAVVLDISHRSIPVATTFLCRGSCSVHPFGTDHLRQVLGRCYPRGRRGARSCGKTIGSM